jgi:hypothetical protein
MYQHNLRVPQYEVRTIHRRCLFCFVEKRGARICLDGRNQTTNIISMNSQKPSVNHRLTEHRRVQLVSKRYQDRGRQNYQKNVAQEEVRPPERHLDNLHDKFPSWLRHRRRAQPSPVPLSCPPRTIGFVVLVLTSQEDGNQEFLDSPLDGNDGNDTQHCM